MALLSRCGSGHSIAALQTVRNSGRVAVAGKFMHFSVETMLSVSDHRVHFGELVKLLSIC